MSPIAADALEFPALAEILKRYTVSPLGQWRLEEFAKQPVYPSREAAEAALAEVREAIDWLHQAEGDGRGSDTGSAPRFQGLRDMRPAAARLGAEGSVLEAHEIYGLLDLLDRAEETRLKLIAEGRRRPRLAAYAGQLHEFGPLLRELSGKVLPNGELADQASPALARIRRQIEQHRNSVHKLLENFVRAHYQEGVLQEDYVTIRNGRLVVPVKTTWKSRVEGVIHSTSSTGQTVFVEPVETIELNNRLAQMIEEEQQEVHRVLREMTGRLRQDAAAIGVAIEILARLELLLAKAKFGKQFHCCIPTFVPEEDARLRLKRARHPLLEDVLGREGRPVEPVSLELERDSRVLVISGPNAGGKTVVLKTVGLLTLMAQAGVPVPADDADFPWFDQVLADIGDAQSITHSLSTFSAHMRQIKAMLESAGPRSLVLLDELGAATDPEEGGALGVAVVDHFLGLDAFAIASTHLAALKTFAATTPGVRNAAVGFDDRTLSPTFRLTVGAPGQSAGLAMAERLGIPGSVISRARQALDTRTEQTAAFLQYLQRQIEEHEAAHKQLRHTERKLREQERKLAQVWERRETAKLSELERRMEQLIGRFEAENKAALEKLAEGSRRASQEAQRNAAKRRRELRQDFQDTAAEALGKPRDSRPAPDPDTLETGATVRLGELGATGKLVREISSGQWEVEVGQLRVRVAAEEITEVMPRGGRPARPAGLPSRITFQGAVRDEASLSEINVIGKTSEEARGEVDKFLDNAVLADVERVRIIHGHGMNVLRRTLWQMFSSHPHVARYYQAEQHEGGAGATIVEVRL